MGITYPSPTSACYGQISPEKYQALLAIAKTKAQPFTPHGDTGSATVESVDISWQYDAAAQELTVTILAKHSLKAKIAGNQAIFGILNDELISKA